jgi:hypothetical protein
LALCLDGKKGFRDYMDDGNDDTFIRCYCELILFGNFERERERKKKKRKTFEHNFLESP